MVLRLVGNRWLSRSASVAHRFRQHAIISPQFASDVDVKRERWHYCNQDFEKKNALSTHVLFCIKGPQDGFGARGGDESSDDDSLGLCAACNKDIGGDNRGARKTHEKACLAARAAAEAIGAPFKPSARDNTERLRRTHHTLAYKGRAVDDVASNIVRDTRPTASEEEKELRARQRTAASFKVPSAFLARFCVLLIKSR